MIETNSKPLRVIRPSEIPANRRYLFDDEIMAEACVIVNAVRDGGKKALQQFAKRFDKMDDESLILDRAEIESALARVPKDECACLRRVANRIHRFAAAQMECVKSLRFGVPGGHAGFDWLPVERAGCYAPAGRYPLVSSVLMTAIPARVANVRNVTVATPKPSDMMLAAAAIADVDSVICAGGAHGIAALAFGADLIEPCDIIVGPGNQWVTAAKYIVSRDVRIDMLAGPSELVIIADESANAVQVAADLLAQAEHDVQALPILITTSSSLMAQVQEALEFALLELPTSKTALSALSNGYAMVAQNLDEAITLNNRIAPEHLQLIVAGSQTASLELLQCGALFIGCRSPEVLGDYGIGPNHVLPTGGGARSSAGLSAMTFLRTRTWLQVDDALACRPVFRDAERLASIEGLPGHARSASLRIDSKFEES